MPKLTPLTHMFLATLKTQIYGVNVVNGDDGVNPANGIKYVFSFAENPDIQLCLA